MAEIVTVTIQDGVAVIGLNNPPVNALGHALRSGLIAALQSLPAGITAVVLHGSARAFSGGADITEFGKPARAPILREVIAAIEAMPIPVVAAIQGVALGGGLELALGCHARVAWKGARLGLPEVKLGILPGAGGTQRLPRIVGIEKALKMIVTGNPVNAEEAQTIGLVDAILTGPYPDAAVAWARGPVERRRVRDREEALEPARQDPALIDTLAAPLLKGQGAAAPKQCVEAIRGAVTLPFDEGLAQERRLFEVLVAGEESRAQRYAFFAEREAQKAKLPAGTAGRPVLRAAVIGAGTMGGGIAMCFANAGIPVTLIEMDAAPLERGLARIRELYATSVKRGSTSQVEADARVARITGQAGLTDLHDADIVIEAVFEELPIKQDVFRTLDRLAKKGAVLASNTSYLDIDAIASATSRPQDVLGMHFFSPANVMKLLEIVRGRATSPEVIATASAVAKTLGKIGIVVGNCFGFVGNRMLARRTEAAERLLLAGASPSDVDKALTDFGFRMGPFQMSDLAGLDVSWRVRKAFPGDAARAPVADALCEAGHYGQKTGRGFYRYEGRTQSADPETLALIGRIAARQGVAQEQLSQEAILEWLLYPMINEAAKILEEGVAERPGDIDQIWIHGYNWPVWRGGPMFYADQVGLPRIRDRMAQFAAQTFDMRYEPAPLLVRLAHEGKGFASLAS